MITVQPGIQAQKNVVNYLYVDKKKGRLPFFKGNLPYLFRLIY